MNFVIDENLPLKLADWLRRQGHAADHIRDLGLGGAADMAISEVARERGAIVVTRDSDFDLIAEVAGIRVLRLTIGNAPTPVLLGWLTDRWTAVEAGFSAASTGVSVVI